MAEVGKRTGKRTQVGRDVYETSEGEMVSEKSTTFKHKGEWVNVPTIFDGRSYDDDTLRMMLDAEVIKPTSTHTNKEDAIKAAAERSESLRFNEGGLADLDKQTEEALGWAAEGKKLSVDIPEVSFKDAGTFVASMTPIIGDAMAAKDVYDELQKDEPNYYLAGALGGAALVGLVPGLGDAAAKAIKKGAKEVFDVAKRVEVDPNAMGSGLGNLRLKPKQDDVAEAAAILDSDEALSAWQQANKIPENKRQANTESAKAAAEDLYQGSITSKEARNIIKEDLPVTSIYTEETMPSMPTVTQVAGSLGKKVQKTGVVGVKGFDIPAGTRVGSRLDIPAYNNYDTWVVSIHDGKNDTKGSVLGYGQAVRLKNIKFGSESQDALDIARGKARLRGAKAGTDTPEKPMGKATIARVYGDYVPEDPYVLQEQARKLLSDPEWTQVGMNPYRQSNFYDKNTGLPVFEADEVIQVGPLVLAKGVKKPTKTQLKELAVRTKDGKLRLFNEGGAVMDEQMEMAFGDAGERVDPVSGNEVPTGSLPEEVRDDIPAQLSEGEYVVPADVVRFFGVKFFEDIRNEAKQGFANMEANGRIGGEPVVAIGMEVVEPQDDLDIMLDDSDFEVVDGYAEGGVVGAASDILTGQAQGLMEYRQYRNPAGEEITIMFFNGMPMSLIPEGYVPVLTDTDLAAAEAAETGSVAASSVAQQQPVYTGEAQPMGGDSDDRTVADMPKPEAVNYRELTPDELRDMVKQGRELAPRTVPLIAGLLNPFAGLAIKAAMWHQSVQVENELKRRLKETDLSEDAKTFYEDLLEIQIADKPSLADKIFKDDSEAEAILGRSYRSPAQLAAEAVDAEVDAEAIDASVRAAFEGDMPTGMAPIADPESIEITSLGDEPGARDYKGPLAGLSPMLDTKGGIPEPYVYEPEAPAVTSPDTANAAAFYASEDMVIADQRRDKINELMAEKKAEREAKMAELDAQIKAQQERLEAQQRAAALAQAQASAQASLAQAASNNNDSNDTYQTAVRAARAAADTRARNQAAGLGAQTKKGSLAGSKSGYFD